MDVDEAGRDDFAGCIDFGAPGRVDLADCGDPFAVDGDIGDAGVAAGPVDHQASSYDCVVGHRALPFVSGLDRRA